MKTDTFLVIGSNSFSGAAFVNYLLTQGHQVIGMSRSEEPSDVFLPYKKNPNLKNFQFHKMDLNHDLENMISVMRDYKTPYVVNFAAQSMVAESWQNPDHWFMTNVVSNVRMHEKLRLQPFLKNYVHISTPEVYGSCSGNVTEDAVFNPSTPYAVSRAAADLSLKSYFKNYKFPVTFTRAANVFGPGQQLYRIVPRTILYFRTGKKLQLHGGGHSVRSFIHIDDVAAGTYQVALRGKPGDAYHFSTPEQISIRNLVEMIAKKCGVKFEDAVEIVNERPGKDAAYLLDSTKAKTEFGWTPKIDLETGVNQTIKWIDENLETIKKLPFDYIHKP
ncbi:MAG: dTDP-glucose 4,6-dehydratase [Proteobacteria bacterium SG_bin7]|nr:MAG: dTDP-glucose 4,6-dehydratase [Proteobacteria bacterium SG_bin7]